MRTSFKPRFPTSWVLCIYGGISADDSAFFSAVFGEMTEWSKQSWVAGGLKAIDDPENII